MRSLSLLLLAALAGVALSQRGNFRQFFQRPQQFRPQQVQQRPQAQAPQQGGGSGGLWLSWQQKPGKYTWGEADATCRQLNKKLISLDSPGKNSQIVNLIESSRVEYIWTSATRSGGNSFTWGNGQRVGNYGWGQTGGDNRPQPDNRAGGEDCLAVLNHFYPG